MLFTITPAALPDGYGEALVPVSDAKAHCNVLTDDDDALIEMLRDAAIDLVEQCAEVALAPRPGRTARFDTFGPKMRIGIGPVATLSVSAIGYTDGAGAVQTLSAGEWRVDAGGGLVPAVTKTFPCDATDVIVTFDCGYPDGACPAPLKHAVKMIVAFFYERREAMLESGLTMDVPFGPAAICARYRMPRL